MIRNSNLHHVLGTLRKHKAIPAMKINAQQGFPWQLSFQPVSRGWIGLGTEARRGDTPIRQVT